MKKHIFAGLFCLQVASQACAQLALADLANCRYQSGIPMPQDECELLRKVEAREQAARARQEAELSRIREADQKQQAEQAERRRLQVEAAEKARAETAAKQLAELQKVEADNAANERLAEAKERQRIASMKAKCGDDYKAPRVGMSIKRAQECVTPMRVLGQINRADGVVTTYQGGGGSVFHAMNGQIVAWTR